ncbi:MAG: 3'-5' exonuclease [Bacteroides sp.]|jgi:DNA helicase-2/ATP-dependent DNA helicase PcrA|nr:3'-5' exonuclease [Bacteroides sp.]
MSLQPENHSLHEEKQFLALVMKKLTDSLKQFSERIKGLSDDMLETRRYLYEHKTGMDRMERYAILQSLFRGNLVGESAVERMKNIEKLLASPYFGRIDFREKSGDEVFPLYIGIHSFYDQEARANVIHDWRAPVSSMFYDFELGEVFFETHEGRVEGDITLKGQYHIRNGKMEYMLENPSAVYDEMLQQVLSENSDRKMRNIVATIQRDQNPIVRNERSRVLIIQGVAGSGKTSIALHRIAFLLYRFKATIKANNILIISPNKVYADYIANVLPELGEERVPEMGMEELGAKLLQGRYKFQTFFEQVSQLLGKSDEGFRERIEFKASGDMLTRLDQYLVYVNNEFFKPADLWVGRSLVPEWFIKEQFESLHRLPVMKRFGMMAKAIEDNIVFYYRRDVTPEERKFILKEVTAMFRITNVRQLYKDFYEWLGQPQMLKAASRSRLEYADVFPLVYLMIRFEGSQTFDGVKHLLVDEMQDYTPLQYAVLARLFSCNKTILGDASQKVSLAGSSTAEMIREVMPDADLVKLRRSYRSTWEITRFAQQILPDSLLIAVERHGEAPKVKGFGGQKEEVAYIRERIVTFWKSGQKTMGIICKTQKQADWLYGQLGSMQESVSILDKQSKAFSLGVVLMPVHLAKGLEFDEVIVPFVTGEHYNTELDKHLLYIACTRAMHRLGLSYAGRKSQFI